MTHNNYIVVHGNPEEGFTHTGPFPSRPDAIFYGETEFEEADWWPVPLESPEDEQPVILCNECSLPITDEVDGCKTHHLTGPVPVSAESAVKNIRQLLDDEKAKSNVISFPKDVEMRLSKI